MGHHLIGIGDIAEGIGRLVEDARGGVSELLFEPVIRLGVTGLSRSGKTVFITSLVANMLERGRMPQLLAASEGRIEASFLQPQPDDDVPRFDYEMHLAELSGPAPNWPDSTRSISQLRLSLRVRGGGLLSGWAGPKTIHIDIVDYPGEWLMDLPLLRLSYEQWAGAALDTARTPSRAAVSGDWLSAVSNAATNEPLDEPIAKGLALCFTDYLSASRKAGFSAIAPGRFLMPGELQGSPALTFAPLPKPPNPNSRSLWREFERRFEAYKRVVILPFFRNHFAKIDRQIVLVDALGALHSGPQAVEDLRQAMADILACFKPGSNSWFAPILGRKIERILFAATKSDHLHHTQHAKLAAVIKALLQDAVARAEFSGAKTQSMAIASLRATIEQSVEHNGESLDMVRGILARTGKAASLHAGDMPDDPAQMLAEGRKGGHNWLDNGYAMMEFLPPALAYRPGMGPPHIRLDRAMQFLIGDRL